MKVGDTIRAGSVAFVEAAIVTDPRDGRVEFLLVMDCLCGCGQRKRQTFSDLDARTLLRALGDCVEMADRERAAN